jgi:5-aminopentanamidase
MTNSRTIRLGLVQPRSFWGSDEEQNVAAALDWLHRCAESSVQLVVFPEGYPGPTNPRNRYDALTPLAEKAAQLGLHVVAGDIEPAAEGGYHVALHLIDDHGRTIGSYRRTHPRDTHVYRDVEMWGFDYRGSSNLPIAFETALGRIGLLVCSEVYVPELSRALALQDAEVIVYPAGGGQGEIIPNWQTVLAARAIENIVYTAASQNLYTPAERGLGMIASPEGVLATRSDAGLIIADLDMGRLAYLRSEDQRIEVPRRCLTVPGLLRWRRPEIFRDEPQHVSSAWRFASV